MQAKRKRFEETMIAAAVKQNDGVIARAAEQLGMARQSLSRRISQLQIPIDSNPIAGEDDAGRPVFDVRAMPGTFVFRGAEYVRLAFTCPVCREQVIHDRLAASWVGHGDGPREDLCGCWSDGISIRELPVYRAGVDIRKPSK